MRKVASLLFGLLTGLQPSGAEADKAKPQSSDQWVIYERVAPDGRPLVVVARTSNAGAQPLLSNGRASVVVCRADAANVNDQGMPQGTNRLYPLEDKLDTQPSLQAAGAIRVASVTGQGERRMFIVHRDPLDLTPLLRSSQVPGFSCAASDVDDRQGMIQLVTPTDLEVQLFEDEDVISSLQKHGDDSDVPRKVDFWFYGSRRSLDALGAELKTHGFSVGDRLSDPSGLVLSRTMPATLAEFKTLTPLIVAAAGQLDVDYDGWETMVMEQSTGGKGH